MTAIAWTPAPAHTPLPAIAWTPTMGLLTPDAPLTTAQLVAVLAELGVPERDALGLVVDSRLLAFGHAFVGADAGRVADAVLVLA